VSHARRAIALVAGGIYVHAPRSGWSGSRGCSSPPGQSGGGAGSPWLRPALAGATLRQRGSGVSLGTGPRCGATDTGSVRVTGGGARWGRGLQGPRSGHDRRSVSHHGRDITTNSDKKERAGPQQQGGPLESADPTPQSVARAMRRALTAVRKCSGRRPCRGMEREKKLENEQRTTGRRWPLRATAKSLRPTHANGAPPRTSALAEPTTGCDASVARPPPALATRGRSLGALRRIHEEREARVPPPKHRFSHSLRRTVLPLRPTHPPHPSTSIDASRRAAFAYRLRLRAAARGRGVDLGGDAPGCWPRT